VAEELGHRHRGGAEASLGVKTLLLDVVVGGLTTGGIYALVALGLNLQYGLMRVLNVAHGEFLMLGAYLTYALHTGWGVNPLLTLVITGPTAFAVGLALHRLLYARLLEGDAPESLESRSLLLSFGLMFVLQNAALLLWRPISGATATSRSRSTGSAPCSRPTACWRRRSRWGSASRSTSTCA